MKKYSVLSMCIVICHFSYSMDCKWQCRDKEVKKVVGYGLYGGAVGITTSIAYDFVIKNVMLARNVFLCDLKKELFLHAFRGARDAFMGAMLVHKVRMNALRLSDQAFMVCFQGAYDGMVRYVRNYGFKYFDQVIMLNKPQAYDYFCRATKLCIVGFFVGCVGGVVRSSYKKKNNMVKNQLQFSSCLYEGVKMGISMGALGGTFLGYTYVMGYELTGFAVSSPQIVIAPLLMCFGSGFVAGSLKRLLKYV